MGECSGSCHVQMFNMHPVSDTCSNTWLGVLSTVACHSLTCCNHPGADTRKRLNEISET
jgi:hypothetical protein